MPTLRLSSEHWRDITSAFERDRTTLLVGPTGIARTDGETRVLVRSLRPTANLPLREWRARMGEIIVVASLEGYDPTALRRLLQEGGLAEARRATALSVRVDAPFAYVSAISATSSQIEPVEALEVAGPGLPRWTLAGPGPEQAVPKDADAVPERFSRTAGAMTLPAWRRLSELEIALVGCGRSGSLVAEALARAGAGGLILIDPDRVEAGNLDAMLGSGPLDADVPKVDVVARALRFARPGIAVEPVALPAESGEAGRRLRRADVLISAVDRDTPRLAVARVAAAYLRPHIDVGTRIDRRGGGLRMGIDVRILLPGEGCVRCVLGLGDEARALRELRAARGIPPGRRGPVRDSGARAWSEERAGSLMSLNMIAIGRALRLFEDLLEGRLRRSHVVRLLWGERGELPGRDEDAAAAPGCPVCATAGVGDFGTEG